jgi:plastocyanin
MRAALLTALAALALGALTAGAARAEGVLRGRVTLDLPGTALADLGPVVVYLDGDGAAKAPAGATPAVHQKDARFAPAFLAVGVGQNVSMPNDDRIFHNVFSYSKPNDFDLGLYASGESRTVPFRHPGLVKLYCSIHESMNGAIFVAPARRPTVATCAPGTRSSPTRTARSTCLRVAS